MKHKELKLFLDKHYERYNHPAFIVNDPVSIPHRFSRKQDIEIMAFFAATLAWGQRKTIINKCLTLISIFENHPYDFIQNHTDNDLKKIPEFKHRTFNHTDLLYFIHALKNIYSKFESLEYAFSNGIKKGDENIKNGIIHFHNLFFDRLYAPERTRKHVSTPAHNSACKRINMFLRWMVRNDNKGVDFGIWKTIKPSQLICPCDLHVDRIARQLNLITRKQTDWHAAEELTNRLKKFDPDDPVKYDFALFGIGVNEKLHFNKN
jgi:uncharacterized protein (TIGR02757 family)